jgi:ketosteroid isomerase-like protein
MYKLILTLGLVSLVATPALAGSPAEKPVLAALDAWKQAMIKKDRAGLEKILHADLSYGHSDGRIEDKAKAIEHVVGGAATLDTIDLADTVVKVNGNTALVTGKVVYHQRENGKLNLVNLVVLSVWSKGAHGWQMIGRLATKPPAPAPATAAAPGATPPAAAPGAAVPASAVVPVKK